MKIASGIGRFGDPFLDEKKWHFLEKVQKVVMGFYREERVPKSLFRTDDVWRALNVDQIAPSFLPDPRFNADLEV